MALAPRHGIETFEQVFGTGERPALAIHCMLGTSGMWEPVLSPLGDRIRATAFDLPGHGKSADWPGEDAEGGYQTLATRIAASFIDRPVDLIGHSFGSSVALRIAAAAPEAIRSLTLIEPVIFAAIADTPEGAYWRAKQDTFDARMAEGAAEPAAREFMADWGVGVPWDEMAERHREKFVRQMPIVASTAPGNFHDSAKILRPDAIEAIDAPVMIVHGTESPEAIRLVSEALAARMQDVGIAAVPGAGHMLPLTHAAQLSDLIALNLERS